MLEIEIIESNIIEGGIEVFVRAWQDGKQIGFGSNGTVDIERFRLINPPVLVQDEVNGDIVIRTEENVELQLPATETRYREDPEEATLRALEETILSLKNKHDDSKIIAGKRGNTTTTVYADPSAYMFNTDASWATMRADGTSVGYDTTSTNEAVFISEKITNYNAGRNIFIFDTSGIPDSDTISSATFSIKSTTDAGSGAETTYPANGALVGVTGTPDGNTSDYGKVNETRYADTDVLRSAFANGVASYKDWVMNATGIANINKTGNTNLGIRASNQFSDSTVPTARSFAKGYFSAASGTTDDPKLVIEHEVGIISQDITATAQATTSLAKPFTKLRALTVIAQATASFIREVQRTLTATAQASTSVVREMAKTLAVTAQATPVLNKGLLYAQSLIVTAQATASLVKTQVTLVAMTVTASASATISQLYVLGVTLVATAQASTSVGKVKSLLRTLTATAQSSASVVKSGLIISRELIVTATATVSYTLGRTLFRTITATGRAVVSLLKDYGYVDKYPENDVSYEDKYPE